MNKTSSLFLLVTLITALCITPALALSIRFTDQNLAGPMNLDVYYVNGTFIDTYNTTQQFDVDESVIIHIAPSRTDYIENPQALLTDAEEWAIDNILPLIAICFILGFVIWRR